MRADGGEAADLAPDLDCLDERQVGKVRPALVWVVEKEDVTGIRTLPDDGTHCVGHRAEVHGDVRGLRDHPSVGVEQRGRGVPSLTDVGRQRATNQYRAHLLRDHRDRVRHHGQLERVEGGHAPSRSSNQPPISRLRATQPAFTRSVESDSPTDAGPAMATSSGPPLSIG
jgi:hypothetical protein